MKQLSLLVLLFLVIALVSPLHGIDKFAGKKMTARYNRLTHTWNTYADVKISDIQFVRPESLAVAEALGGTYVGPRWNVQASPLMGDTVNVTALVIVPSAADPPNPGITFTQHGWTMLLHDTAANSNRWGGALVRVGADGAAPDTAQARLDGFNNVARGDWITMTVRIEEFPLDNSINTTTQLRPVPGLPIDILSSSHAIPAPTLLTVDSFYVGGYPGGAVNFHIGEAYEGSLVRLLHLTVFDYVNTTRGTWSMKDAAGNYIADLDASHYWTFGNETPTIPGDPSFQLPVLQAVVDTITGTMLSNSGGENPRGYRICPLYIGDVKYGTSLPTIITHRRFPVIVSSSDTVRIHSVVRKTPGGNPIASATLFVSVENAAFTAVPMTMISLDSTYEGLILDPDNNPWGANTHIRYFMKAIDDHGLSNILANSSSNFNSDTSKGFFFYQVLDRPLTIHDVQFTPYPNGRSPYLGGVTTIGGVVTASSRDINVTPLNTGGTSAWYIQNGNIPWSGIWVVKDTVNHAQLDSVHLGDSITVSGTIQEQFDVTRISDSIVTINAHNRPLPAPLLVNTGTFGVRGNGDTTAEKYEGVLMKVVNAPISNLYPIFSDSTEYAIDDGSGPMLVRRDGINSYSNLEADTSTLASSRILHAGDKMDTLIGVGWFSFTRYKIVPRTNRDIVAGDLYPYDNTWNIVSIGKKQLPASTGYLVDSLFPGRASPAFAYSGSYVLSPTLSVGTGYWVRFNGARNIGRLGIPVTLDSIPLAAGWNLIGALASPVTTASIVTNPGNHLGSFFGYSAVGGYSTVSSLTPGRGFWVKAEASGYLVESTSGNIPKIEASPMANFNSITITDRDGNSQTLYFGQDAQGKIALKDFELPPSGPVEGFDVRWNTDRILETYPAVVGDGKSFAISLKANNGPLTVGWNIVGKDGKHFTLADAENGKKMKTLNLTGAGTSFGLKAGTEKLVLHVSSGAEIPREYSLGQNYPNPFNPTTTFIVGLPEAAHLEVAIYNVLGQKVVALVDEVRDAGYYPVTWNSNTQAGLTVSSGVYFVRMNAEKFTAVHKMMLLK
jgi:hypothetical protein